MGNCWLKTGGWCAHYHKVGSFFFFRSERNARVSCFQSSVRYSRWIRVGSGQKLGERGGGRWSRASIRYTFAARSNLGGLGSSSSLLFSIFNVHRCSLLVSYEYQIISSCSAPSCERTLESSGSRKGEERHEIREEFTRLRFLIAIWGMKLDEISDVNENNGRNGGNVPINRYSMHGNWFLIIKLGGNNWNKDLEFSYTVFPRERKTSCVLINLKNWKIILFFFLKIYDLSRLVPGFRSR